MKKFMRGRITIVILAVMAMSASALFALEDRLSIKAGEISGTAESGKPAVVAFRGIPFAAPPVGELRWKPPIPVAPWEGVRECKQFGSAAMQARPPMAMPGMSPNTLSEDCLYLNVWTPARTATEKLPVMVWIHGGGFMMGSGSEAVYDGTPLARLGVVVVTINYRLGVFGFLAHPLLTKESPHGSSGNYGLLDQIAALEWVRDNIDAFGGDSNRVTIFGESAGGGSVSMLMTSPLAKGLFHRAIAQSGTVGMIPTRHLKESRAGAEPMEFVGTELAKAIGCADASDELTQLRAKTAEQIMVASAKTKLDPVSAFSARVFPYTPIVDGWVVPEDPATVFMEGRQHKVPLMIGATADEGALFVMTLSVKDTSRYEEFAGLLMRDFAPRLIAMHPVSDAATMKSKLAYFATVSNFVAPSRFMARASEKIGAPVYYYHYTKHHSKGFGSNLGAHHAAELPYVFGTVIPMNIGDESDVALSETMMKYWTRFAAAGDPNGGELPEWPTYAASKDEHLELGAEVKTGSGLMKADCDLIEEAMRTWRKAVR